MDSINNTYEISIIDRLAVIKIKENAFGLLSDPFESDTFIESLDKIQYDPHIKSVLFLNQPDCFGEDVYDEFIKKMMISFDESERFDTPNFCDKFMRFKEMNILIRFVKYLSQFNKFCFTLLSGGIVTPFFGASMALDIRYATPDMYFSLSHIKYGLHPSGGLPYFLVHQLGYNKAMELLLQDKISAKEALELGLINRIIKSDNPIDEIINEVQDLTSIRSCTLRRTKQLAAFTRDTLDDYFMYESSLLNL